MLTRLVRQHRLDGGPFIVGEFVAHDSSPQFESLNHGSPVKRNALGPTLVRRLRTRADINSPQSLPKLSKLTLTGHATSRRALE
jgi:hypothetical protein